MGLVTYNKRFLAGTVSASESTHDARLLRHTSVFNDVVSGPALPDETIYLGDEYGEIPCSYYFGIVHSRGTSGY